jgi:hypothetical protein
MLPAMDYSLITTLIIEWEDNEIEAFKIYKQNEYLGEKSIFIPLNVGSTFVATVTHHTGIEYKNFIQINPQIKIHERDN